MWVRLLSSLTWPGAEAVGNSAQTMKSKSVLTKWCLHNKELRMACTHTSQTLSLLLSLPWNKGPGTMWLAANHCNKRGDGGDLRAGSKNSTHIFRESRSPYSAFDSLEDKPVCGFLYYRQHYQGSHPVCTDSSERAPLLAELRVAWAQRSLNLQ